MTMHNSQTLPSLRKLFRATGIAILLAGAILISAVLPAEFGIDPTGIGKALGLTSLSAASPRVENKTTNASLTEAAVPTAGSIVIKSDIPLKNDEMTLTLKPNEGAEIKATMRKGERLVYNWTAAGGVVNVDMHGEKTNDKDNFTTYWKAMQIAGDQGTFAAPFDGTHGWFWRNRSDQTVTVKVKVSGFYEKFERKI